MQFKFDKKLVAALAVLAVSILGVFGLTKYEPVVQAVKGVLDSQVQQGPDTPVAEPVVSPDAGL